MTIADWVRIGMIEGGGPTVTECLHEYVADMKETGQDGKFKTFIATRIYCRKCGMNPEPTAAQLAEVKGIMSEGRGL